MPAPLRGHAAQRRLQGMEWLALIVWIVALMLVLPAGGTLLASLGLLVMVTVVGLGSMIVFGVTGVSVWAWISFGMACAAVVLATVGARTLIYDTAQTLEGIPELIKGAAALSLGVGIAIIIAAVPITLGTAVR
jgi:hypothetical protein